MRKHSLAVGLPSFLVSRLYLAVSLGNRAAKAARSRSDTPSACKRAISPAIPVSSLPRLMLRAWERPEDLHFLNSRQVGVAFLAGTIEIGEFAPAHSLSADDSVTLGEKLPLPLLAEAAGSRELPAPLCAQIAIAGWTNSILLRDAAAAHRFTPPPAFLGTAERVAAAEQRAALQTLPTAPD